MTAYRHRRWPARPRDLKAEAPDTAKIPLHNVYGWCVRVERGLYALSNSGQAALVVWKAHLPAASDEELMAAATS